MEQNSINKILLTNNLVSMKPVHNLTHTITPADNDTLVATVLSNLSYYGYTASLDMLTHLKSYNSQEIKDFWAGLEPALKEVTGDNKNMGDFVVYKNFPKEVLEKTQAQYWIAQILMYWGLPNELFTQPTESRPQMLELKSLKVLSVSDIYSLSQIYSQLLNNPSAWTDSQKEHAKELLTHLNQNQVNIDSAPFKENAVLLAQHVIDNKLGIDIQVSNATDILRLASAMSGGDISLRTPFKFKTFKRPERRLLLSLLDNSQHLMEDISLRPEIFKRLLKALHPGDYKFHNVISAYDNLYKENYVTFNSEIESKLNNKDNSVLDMLKTKPGDFVRRFHHTYEIFKGEAIEAFNSIIPQLTTIQLVKLSKYVETINGRKELIYAPNGNWTKAQVMNNSKEAFEDKDKESLLNCISQELSSRLKEKFPEGVSLGSGLDKIKLQTNDQELASYGRGTEFSIPDNMSYIRTASYWAQKSYGNNWFDNGWNFFDSTWQPIDTCCWNKSGINGAVFSGDPTNSKDIQGRACQMIDLNLEQLAKEGVRYAVWNILSFSHIPFSQANVMATLQWGEDPQSGKLYEPSRAQMVFPLKGDNLTKYVAYIDIIDKKLIFINANLYGIVGSATNNELTLKEKMPAFIEYLNSLPSVLDLLKHAPAGNTTNPTCFAYSDKDIEIKEGSAYVFKPENPNNKFTAINLADILSYEKPKMTYKMKK